MNKKVEQKLIDAVTNTLKYREENNVVRNDFLQLLMELRKSSEANNFTELDVTAQATTFFVDGYETTATAISFVLYELASHPEVQIKLRKEVTECFEKNGEMSYEDLQQLPFLDAVISGTYKLISNIPIFHVYISETLRLEVPLFALLKLCTEPYTYTPKKSDGITKPVVIEKGTSVIIPIGAFQRDPKYFEDPDTFNPERFMGENKEKISKDAYIPFGVGPRTCLGRFFFVSLVSFIIRILGRRFALLQTKSAVASIVKNFELTLNKKTIVPLQYDPIAGILTPKGGIWLDIKKVD